eukprot:g1676.t1
MHQLPTTWFSPFKQEVIERDPWAADVPIGSRLWLYLTVPCGAAEAKAMEYMELNPEFRAQYADLGPFTPQHPLAAKLVTSHHDYHPGNLLDLHNGSGLRIIDLETCGVDHAIHDLMAALASCSFDTSKSHAFLTGYLDALGHATTAKDITMLLLDAHLFAAFSVRVWMSPPGFLGLSSQEAMDRLESWRAYARAVRASESEQAELLKVGPQKSFARAGLIPSE